MTGIGSDTRSVTALLHRYEYRSAHLRAPEWALDSYLEEATRILMSSHAAGRQVEDPVLSADFEELRWFPLPSEISSELGASEVAGDAI
ncbi:MAG: hypothetical protein E4H11_01315 [Myxococcales bacterium]|nr:MAG: hypothetical protein E4H11_01315 [Myxococcales bacterium]